uniref:Uncharacterized protein n=1 Tax=Anguilla anguilla TaxID=7936 RepID=A0A0E9V014_ANGAN
MYRLRTLLETTATGKEFNNRPQGTSPRQ